MLLRCRELVQHRTDGDECCSSFTLAPEGALGSKSLTVVFVWLPRGSTASIYCRPPVCGRSFVCGRSCLLLALQCKCQGVKLPDFSVRLPAAGVRGRLEAVVAM